MLPQYESFLDATPEKGVILVEYYWQPPTRLNPTRRGNLFPTPSPRRRGGDGSSSPIQRGELAVGTKTSMVFFKRILAADKCWCGSGRAFSKCHRRADDWTYVALDPDRRFYSPVVLLERTFPNIHFAHACQQLANDKRLLCVDYSAERAEWALPAHPPIVNEIGQLVIGSVELTPRGLRIETNSEKRLEHITGAISQILGTNLGQGTTRRAEPQKTFSIRGRC